MNAIARLQSWWRDRQPVAETADDTPWDRDASSWALSLLAHLGILVTCALVTIVVPKIAEVTTLVPEELSNEDPMATVDQFTPSDEPQEAIGAAGGGIAEGGTVASLAPQLELGATLPSGIEVDSPSPVAEKIQIQDDIRIATGPRFSENLTVKGLAGVGITGATGAVDRITQEILLALEQRKTLVVWFFDQSGSLERQRAEIIQRFDRVYEELGLIEASGNPAFKKHDSKPLLTAAVAFGEGITFLTPKPTDAVQEIKSAVSSIKTDTSGVERTFTAVRNAAERFRQFRTQEPRRNVMFIIFSDEAGDDESELDSTVALCRRYEIPVYCVGVPAPFGRRETLVKYVDPDPKYDQTPQWIPVRQGPESYMPELVKIGSLDDEPLDSGFGPYSLTRLCYETGGIYFAVHPNRTTGRGVSRRDTAVSTAAFSHFFDPQVMLNYRPDYVPVREYQKLLAENKARSALVQAAQMSWVTPMERPELFFPKVNDAELANRLSRAQRDAAVLEPKIQQLYEVLKQGEKDRAKLTVPRWQAGYDLSMGSLLALKVRTESYNAMLAKAKTGLRFQDAKNDTWRLAPADEITVGSALEKQAAEARNYLERVLRDHPDTPWAMLAASDLKQPFGWKWQEAYTGVNERRQAAAGNNNNRPPRDDRAKMLNRPQKRPAPKL